MKFKQQNDERQAESRSTLPGMKNSLSIKLPLLFIAATIVIMLVVIFAVHSRFQAQMMEDYTRRAEGVTTLMADRIDGDKVDEYMEKNFELPEYREIVDYFYKLKANYPDVLYMYSFRAEEDGGHMIIDLDADEVENGDAFEAGYVYVLDEPFFSLIPLIMAGGKTDGYAVHTQEDGYLFSYCSPVFDSNGHYACSVCVDFSLDRLESQNNAFTLRLAMSILVISMLILLIEVLIVRRWVTDPIQKLSQIAKKFSYKTEADRKNNIELLDAVNLKSRDEIGIVYQMLRSVTNDSFNATQNLSRAKIDIQDKEKKITAISKDAYWDKLTRVGNLAAYKRDTVGIDGDYALVMFDINNLKTVNDTCGHGKGDLYIQGCCRIIGKQLRHSSLYRTGGDEFVAVLKGEDFEKREHHLEELSAAFEGAQKKSQLWERYSSAVGMAVHRESETVEEVLKRADEAMYLNKAEWHRKYGKAR